MAGFATQHGVETLVIGAELDSLTQWFDIAEWKTTVGAVRSVFKTKPVIYLPTVGHAIYLAQEYWALFDYVGTTFWPDIAQAASPSVAEIVAGWQSQGWPAKLEAMTNKAGKKLILGEIGWRSRNQCCYHAWDWSNEYPSNAACQANAYESLFQVLGGVSWVSGALFWQVNPEVPCAPDDSSYCPFYKPVQGVLDKWL